MAQVQEEPHGKFTTIGSFACLAALVLWLVFCYTSLAQADRGAWLAGFSSLFAASVGAWVLALLGVACGLAATGGTGRRAGWGAVALDLNAIVLVCGLVFLLLFFGLEAH